MSQDIRYLQTEDRDGTTIVTIDEPYLLDAGIIRDLGQQLMELAIQRGRVLVDMGKVEYLSSTMLGKLISLHRKLEQLQGRLGLCRISADAFEIFQLSKLDEYFEIFPDLEAGLKALAADD